MIAMADPPLRRRIVACRLLLLAPPARANWPSSGPSSKASWAKLTVPPPYTPSSHPPTTGEVLLLGDFNVDAIREQGEYHDLLRTLALRPEGGPNAGGRQAAREQQEWHDVLLSAHKNSHPPTTVPYSWDPDTGLEVRSSSYLDSLGGQRMGSAAPSCPSSPSSSPLYPSAASRFYSILSRLSALLPSREPDASTGRAVVKEAQRLDYVLLRRREAADSRKSGRLAAQRAAVRDFAIEPHSVPSPSSPSSSPAAAAAAAPFALLSDHFGVEVDFVF
jgi:hypothetical protein